MKKLLLILILALAPSLVWGQCSGVFPANTVCGNSTASSATPSARPYSAFAQTLAVNQIFVGNASNVAAAVPMSQDCTIVSSGIITCTKTNNVPFGAMATLTATASGDLSGTWPNITVTAIQGLAWQATTYTTGQVPTWNATNSRFEPGSGGSGAAINVQDSGAVGDCTTDDTVAFQSAINTAYTGAKNVYIPKPTGACYLVSAINMTNKPGMTIFGDGDTSVVQINGSSTTNKNWWDITGSNNTTFRNFKVTGTSGVVPKILIFAAAASGGNNILNGIHFDHLNIDAYSSEGHFYGYGIAYVNSSTYVGGAGGMTCLNSLWYQRKNGGSVSTANPSLYTAVAIFDGINSRSLASDYATVTTANPGTQSINLTNCNFISYPSGVGAGTKDANVPLVMVTVGQFVMTNGSVQCLSFTCNAIWSNTEGVRFDSVVFKNSDGGGGATATSDYYHIFGGGINGFVMFDNVFYSDLPNRGGSAAYIGVDVTSTQLGSIKVRNPDIGANTYSNKFISTIGGCGGHTAANFQIYQGFFELWDSNNAIQICDSIDRNTVWLNRGSLVQASAGAVDYSAILNNGAAVAFATLPTCSAGLQGITRIVGDSNTATFNATIAGGGGNVVIALCNASNWVVH